MKISAGTIGTQLAIFAWCIFMGVTAVSIGVGAAWPPLNLVAKPFVCPNGQMVFSQETSNPLPGTTYTITGWACVDNQTGVPTELDIFTIALPAGVIYGLVIEVVVVLVMWNMQRQKGAAQPVSSVRHNMPRHTYDSGGPAPRPVAGSAHAVVRMQELQALRDKNLISEAQFEQKRDEILKDL